MERQFQAQETNIAVRCTNYDCTNVNVEYLESLTVDVPVTGRLFVTTDINQLSGDCPVCHERVSALGQVIIFQDGTLQAIHDLRIMAMDFVIDFTHCLQDAVDYGESSEFMISEVFFRIRRGDDIRGERARTMSCTIRQPYNENGPSLDNLLVVTPIALQNEVDNEQFHQVVRDYFILAIGPLRAYMGPHNRVRNNRLVIGQRALINASEDMQIIGPW